MRGDFLEFAVDNGLLKLDGEASVSELLDFSETIYDLGALHAVRDLMVDGVLPDMWVRCDLIEEKEFWKAVRDHLKERDLEVDDE
jgi:hypothetical protein